MAGRKQRLVEDRDVYGLTRRGEAELRGSSTTLPAAAIELLARIDGTSPVSSLRAAVGELPADNVAGTFEWLLHHGLIARVTHGGDGILDFDEPSAITASLAPSSTAVSTATREAAAGLTSLQQQGYYVRIARRPAGRPQLPSDRKPLVMIVEDEAPLAQSMQRFMALEGFDVRVAATRHDITRVLREPPRPDLVLLEAVLPDADGFEVLMKIRRHPALGEVPVIVLTAQTTRESIVKALACGADGCIAKPFETDVLVKAIKTTFGMSHAQGVGAWGTRGA
jgi:two-component system OmpR family response regulator